MMARNPSPSSRTGPCPSSTPREHGLAPRSLPQHGPGTFYSHARSVACTCGPCSTEGDGRIRMRAIAVSPPTCCPLQGRLRRAARRRARALGVDRAVSSARAHGRSPRSRAWYDPSGLMNSPARREHLRNRTTVRYFRNKRTTAPFAATALDWSAWGGLSGPWRCNNNATAASSTPGPCAELSRDPRRGHSTPRPGPTRSARPLGPARRRASLRMRCARPSRCRLLQGMACECPTGVDMARMKTRSFTTTAPRTIWRARPAGRHAPGLRAVGVALRAAGVRGPAAAGHLTGDCRARRIRRAPRAAVVQREALARRPGAARCARGARSRPVRGHLQQLVRARQPRRRNTGDEAAGSSGARSRADARPLSSGGPTSRPEWSSSEAESRRMIEALAPWIERGYRGGTQPRATTR